jgi:hypothetical protein
VQGGQFDRLAIKNRKVGESEETQFHSIVTLETGRVRPDTYVKKATRSMSKVASSQYRTFQDE